MRSALLRLVTTLAVGAILVIAAPASAQTPPTYPELFQEPLPTPRLTAADLPNLGRLVSLEATSMYVHARDELYDSPAGRRLLDDIGNVWISADAFTAAVSFDSVDASRVEAGLLTLPDLLAAYGRLRESVDTIPGRTFLTVSDFRDMSRVVAVLGPILREASRDLETAGPLPPVPGDLADLQLRSRSISGAIEPLTPEARRGNDRHRSIGPAQGSNRAARSARAGLVAVVAGQPEDRDVVSVLPPLAIAGIQNRPVDLAIEAPCGSPRRMEECTDADR